MGFFEAIRRRIFPGSQARKAKILPGASVAAPDPDSPGAFSFAPDAPASGRVEYQGYRFMATGALSYDVFRENDLVCSVAPSALIPDQPRTYSILAHGISWQRSGSESPTLYPGVRFVIRDSDTDEPVSSIEYVDVGRYIAHVDEDSVDVSVLEDFELRYSRAGQLVGAFHRRDDPGHVRKKWGDEAPARYSAWCDGALSHGMKTLLLCAPFLAIVTPAPRVAADD